MVGKVRRAVRSAEVRWGTPTSYLGPGQACWASILLGAGWWRRRTGQAAEEQPKYETFSRSYLGGLLGGNGRGVEDVRRAREPTGITPRGAESRAPGPQPPARYRPDRRQHNSDWTNSEARRQAGPFLRLRVGEQQAPDRGGRIGRQQIPSQRRRPPRVVRSASVHSRRRPGSEVRWDGISGNMRTREIGFDVTEAIQGC